MSCLWRGGHLVAEFLITTLGGRISNSFIHSGHWPVCFTAWRAGVGDHQPKQRAKLPPPHCRQGGQSVKPSFGQPLYQSMNNVHYISSLASPQAQNTKPRRSWAWLTNRPELPNWLWLPLPGVGEVFHNTPNLSALRLVLFWKLLVFCPGKLCYLFNTLRLNWRSCEGDFPKS